MMELEEAVGVLEETLQGDLESCARAIRAADLVKAGEHLEIAIAKLSGLTDMLRAAGGGRERD
jgi:hypothetical protein